MPLPLSTRPSLVALCALIATPGLAQDAAPERVSVAVGKATLVRTEQPFAEVVLPRPEIANVQVMTSRSFYVYGREAGATNVMFFDARKQLVQSMDIEVGYDTAGLQAAFSEALPGESVRAVSTPNGIVLRGEVSSSTAAADAAAFAERYAPGKVTNALTVRGPQQVVLEVRFLEASRSVARELGVDTFYTDLNTALVSTGFGLPDFIGDALESGRQAAGSGAFRSGQFEVQLDALERTGVIRTLARPNIAALSGDTASFLAGGEFPIPVAADNDRVTVEFKEYGVALSFTPTVLEDGKINLKVVSEVSQLDLAGSIRISDIELPALTVRRASTTVEMNSGEAMAMAGLLQSNYQNRKAQTPWLGDVPVLGALFRSARFERGETELVVIVTPKLVTPVAGPDKVASPLDATQAPNDAQLFLNGQVSVPAK